LETAKLVCSTLNSNSPEFERYKTEIREGLITSINKMHPRTINVNQEKITWISKQFLEFTNIFTTNYDLFLYYIILEARKFNDHFFSRYNAKYNCFENPDVMDRQHIYYLHEHCFYFLKDWPLLK
jgi:hypothetical protein